MDTTETGPKVARFRIDAMCCAVEEGLIRGRLELMPGIAGLEFNLIQRVLTVRHELPETRPIVAAIKSLHFEPISLSDRHAGSEQVVRYRVPELDCSAEESLIRGKLEPMVGVTGLEFNIVQQSVTISHTLSDSEPLAASLRSLGFSPEPFHADSDEVSSSAGGPGARVWVPLIAAAVLALGSEAADLARLFSPWLSALLAVAAVALSGWSVFVKGWTAVVNRTLNINALMSIAVTGALVLRLWPEASMVMVLFALAERIEALSLDRARKAIATLLSLAPDHATVQQDGTWVSVPSDTVKVDAVVRVRPGERISHDGVILRGTSSVDQSPITGESVPVDKAVGDAVFAGTVNQHGELEFRVTALVADSALSRIVHLVEEAQSHRAPTQRFVDQFAKVYTPLVFLTALLVAVLPPLVGAGGWSEWIYRALVLMVIACPCALVISTPVTIVSGLSAAARAGILVKGGTFLEQGRRLKVVAFDKTGTVTHGRPELTNLEPFQGSTSEVQSVAVSLASRSDHPVSQAVARSADRGAELAEVSEFRAVPGRGVQGVIGGTRFVLGNHRWMTELNLSTPALEARLEALESEGKTTVLVADQARVLGILAVADTVKPTSRQAVGELHALGVKTLMLSGDNARTVDFIARSVGLDEAHGDQLPQDKLDKLTNLSGPGRTVAMVGDGINDAPALARADIGFAMGGAGTGTAIETADVVLMDDDLRKVPRFIRLSRRTSSVLVQNIALALGLKAVFFALTIVGLGTMWMAVFADMGTSLIVVFNGLRLLSDRLPPRENS